MNEADEPTATGAPGPPSRRWSPWWHWAPWLWAVVVVIVSVVPAEWLLGAAPEQSWSVLASLAHALELAVLAGLLVWKGGREQRTPRPSVAVLVRAAATSMVLAVLVEAVQWPLPYRSFDGLDLAADAAGIVLGLGLSSWALRRAGRRCDR